jgi:hypothetical protein
MPDAPRLVEERVVGRIARLGDGEPEEGVGEQPPRLLHVVVELDRTPQLDSRRRAVSVPQEALPGLDGGRRGFVLPARKLLEREAPDAMDARIRVRRSSPHACGGGRRGDL